MLPFSLKVSFQLGLFVLILSHVETSIVRLFNELHFYELRIQKSGEILTRENFQRFDHDVIGDETCLPKSFQPWLDPPVSEIQRSFHLNSQPIIYSNDQQTLSFLLDINFTVPKDSTMYEGVEIEITTEHGSSCLQIMPSELAQLGDEDSIHYRFRIKDPSFISVVDERFTFYFGKVAVKPLVQCSKDSSANSETSNKALCAVENMDSSTVTVGIPKAEQTDTSYYSINDLCEGHLMIHTCIMRYRPGDSNLIIMHPMPAQFNRVTADMNIMTYMDALASYPRLKIGEENASFVWKNDIPKILLVDSYQSQKLANNLVFKFFDYYSQIISYSSFLKDPAEGELCTTLSRESGVEKCECKGSCDTICYSLPGPTINRIFMNQSDTRSLHCHANEFYRAFNFENIQIEKMFQNQLLSKKRQLHAQHRPRSHSNLLSALTTFKPVRLIRQTMPRICANFNYEASSGQLLYRNLTLFFDDKFKVARSSLIDTNYTLNLYQSEYTNASQTINPRSPSKMVKITTNLVLSLNLSDLLKEIPLNLKAGDYFAELIQINNNTLCSNKSMCVDETTTNNQIQCVPCNKLIVHFGLYKSIQEAVRNEADKWSWMHRRDGFAFSQFPLCPTEADSFTESLAKSNHEHGNTRLSGEEPSTASLKSLKFISSYVPSNFNLSQILVPYRLEEIKIEATSQGSRSWIEHLESGGMVLLLALLIGLAVMIWVSYKSHFNNCAKKKKRVVFYLSIFVNENSQAELEELASLYKKNIQKLFPWVHIDIVGYKTNSFERERLLGTCDLIIYVFAARSELLRFGQPSIKIGQNSFHFDHDRIHFIDKYMKKRINVTFNRDAENYLGKENNFKLLENTTVKTPISLDGEMIKSIKYFRLPTENKQFIKYLLNDCRDFCNYLDIGKVLMFLLRLNLCFAVKLNRKLAKYFDYRFQNDINFDHQPYRDSIIFEHVANSNLSNQ